MAHPRYATDVKEILYILKNGIFDSSIFQVGAGSSRLTSDSDNLRLMSHLKLLMSHLKLLMSHLKFLNKSFLHRFQSI